MLSNAAFETPREWPCMANLAISKESVAKLGVPFESICLLDSESPTMLTPEDASRFSHFLFGGILGNSKDKPTFGGDSPLLPSGRIRL